MGDKPTPCFDENPARPEMYTNGRCNYNPPELDPLSATLLNTYMKANISRFSNKHYILDANVLIRLCEIDGIEDEWLSMIIEIANEYEKPHK